MAAYWRSCHQELFPLPESEISPLLISLPYKADSKTMQRLLGHKSLLMSMGFSIDQLSESALALRSVPKFLALLPYQKAVWALFEFMGSKEKVDLEVFFSQPLPLDLAQCRLSQLASMAQKIGPLKDLRRPPLLPLTPETLDGFFS